MRLAKTETSIQQISFIPGKSVAIYNQNFTRAYLFRTVAEKEEGQEDFICEELEYTVFRCKSKHLVFSDEDATYVHSNKTEDLKSVKLAKAFLEGRWERRSLSDDNTCNRAIADIRITIFTLYGKKTLINAQIVQGARKRKSVNLYKTPECVNACYTTGIMGHIPDLETLKCLSQNNERSGFGSDFTTSTIFGVMEVFPTCNGRRRVICKAYNKAERANYDVCFLCDVLGTTQTESIKMHMSVWKATTGQQMDISKGGYFFHWIEREFTDSRGPFFTYRGQTDELDVHCVVEVQNFFEVAEIIMDEAEKRDVELQQSLGSLGLYLSCTCMGVCIYRVARHNRNFEFCTLKQEKWIYRTLCHLHTCLAQYGALRTHVKSNKVVET